MGPERKSRVISDKDKRVAAYHEVGHALVAKLTEGADPVHKVTIIPRGMALGLTQSLPEEDRYMYSEEYCHIIMTHLLGGRAAEKLAFNSMTSGAGNDIDKATDLARKMVTEWGMSPKLGPVAFGEKDEAIFLGRELATHRDFSEETAETIDTEIRRIIDDAYDRALKLLKGHKNELVKIADILLERETLTGDEIDILLEGGELPPMKPAEVTAEEPAKEKKAKKPAAKKKEEPDKLGKPVLEA
jgi:cell division protease FtsH